MQNQGNADYPFNVQQDIISLYLHESKIQASLADIPMQARLVLGFVKPSVDIASVGRKIKSIFPSATVILASSSGLLCSRMKEMPLDNLYGDGIEGSDITLLLMSHRIIKNIHVANIRLGKEINNPKIILPKVRENATTVWHQFVIRSLEREELIQYLNRNEIGSIIHYPIPPHLS